MNAQNIDLAKIFEEQERLRNKVADATAALDKAQSELSQYNAAKKAEIDHLLVSGKSLGDPLQNEAFAVFGLGKNALDKTREFSDLLVKSRGADVLMTFTHPKRIRFGNSLEKRDFVTQYVYVFGKLSGERLKLTTEANSSFIMTSVAIPFEKHVLWSSDLIGQEAYERKSGAFVLGGTHFEPRAQTMLDYLVEKESESKVAIQIGSWNINYKRSDIAKASTLLESQETECALLPDSVCNPS